MHTCAFGCTANWRNGYSDSKVTGQSWRVGRACPQRAGPRFGVYGGALRTGAPYVPLSLTHSLLYTVFILSALLQNLRRPCCNRVMTRESLSAADRMLDRPTVRASLSRIA